MRSTEHRPATTEWAGQPAFDRFSAGRFATPDPHQFRATWRRTVVDGLQLGEWATTPVAGALLPAGDTGLTIIAILDGTARYSIDNHAVVAETGSMHVLPGTSRVRFAIPTPTRLLRIAVPAGLLPDRTRTQADAMTGPVPASPLTDTLLALTEQVLHPTDGGPDSPAARAVHALVTATLEELTPVVAEQQLRDRILEHIDRYLIDPDLSPSSIAD